MKPKQVAVIHNPNGGSASKSNLTEMWHQFRAQGIQSEHITWYATTAEPGSAGKLAGVAVDRESDLVIVCGGDGTVCQVAERLIGTGIPLTVFPMGTGNLFARTYYSEPTPKQFVEMVLAGQPQPVDVIRTQYSDATGKPHDTIFLVGFGLGKVSDAISTASPVYKRIFGRLCYVFKVSLACLFPTAQRFHLTSATGETAENAAAMFVMNVTPTAMATLSRGCNSADGLMDVVVFRADNAFQLINVAACLAFNRPESSKHYHRFRTSELTIRCEEEVLPNIDGDAGAPTKEIKLTVEPRAVMMILSS